MEGEMTPQYKHHCDKCIFVGRIEATDADGSLSPSFDGYYCPKHSSWWQGAAIVLRVSDEMQFSGFAIYDDWRRVAMGEIMSHPDAYKTLFFLCVKAGHISKCEADIYTALDE